MDTIGRDKTPTKRAEQPRDKATGLRAKPVKGEIDYKALIQEHIARYPKIIAALAEAEQRCAERKRQRSE